MNTCRIAFGALALAAAQWATPIPLYVAVALGGVLLIGLPLRSFRVSRAIAVCGWLAAVGIVAATYEAVMPRSALRVVGSSVALALVVIAAYAILSEANELSPAPRNRLKDFLLKPEPGVFRIPAVGSGFIAGGGLLILAVALMFAGSAGLAWAALILSIISISGATAVAAIAGVVHGVGAARPPKRRFPYPTPFIARQVAIPTRPIRPIGQVTFGLRLAFTIRLFFVRVLQRIAVTINLFLRVVTRAGYLVVRTICNALDWIWVRIVLVLSAIANAARATTKTILASIVAAVGALGPWTRSVVATAGLLVLLAMVGIYGVSRFAVYLSSGGIDKGVEAICLFAVAPVLAGAVWWSTTRMPRKEIVASAMRSLEYGGPSSFLTILALAWGDGVLGWLGVGPIRPGWLTYAGTIVLLAGSLFFMRKTPERRTAVSS